MTNRETHLKLTGAGVHIYPSECGKGWAAEKVPTPDYPQAEAPVFSETYAGALEQGRGWLRSYHGCRTYSVMMRYHRGLGVEYRNLPPVEATSPQEAQQLAEASAVSYVASAPNMEKAVVQEVRIRPVH